ncbi:hypothetical protein CYMTET_15756 [Cymbomonas tetramitiformis]|uniref:Uncharacterized protein n=1 Tax=Cymbomonas tetramitiformis TaxID=36881 RepID=A0AAE0L911_9CHLO|nr:hypothetical protein CYMTET_15756 [Cymbomonas tetramitiformis]
MSAGRDPMWNAWEVLDVQAVLEFFYDIVVGPSVTGVGVGTPRHSQRKPLESLQEGVRDSTRTLVIVGLMEEGAGSASHPTFLGHECVIDELPASSEASGKDRYMLAHLRQERVAAIKDFARSQDPRAVFEDVMDDSFPLAGEGHEPEYQEEEDAMSMASGLEFIPMEPGRWLEALGAYIFYSGVRRDQAGLQGEPEPGWLALNAFTVGSAPVSELEPEKWSLLEGYVQEVHIVGIAVLLLTERAHRMAVAFEDWHDVDFLKRGAASLGMVEKVRDDKVKYMPVYSRPPSFKVNPAKCKGPAQVVEFLGFLLSTQGRGFSLLEAAVRVTLPVLDDLATIEEVIRRYNGRKVVWYREDVKEDFFATDFVRRATAQGRRRGRGCTKACLPKGHSASHRGKEEAKTH